MGEFTDKKVLVTGGTTGIGFATARAFLEGGADVLITGANAERVKSAAERLGPRCDGLVADNAQVAGGRAAATACEARFGRLDVLVANAGVCLTSHIDSLDEAGFDREMATNFKGTFFLIQACLPLLGPGACILVTTSINDVKGFPGQVVYSATKAALRSMVRTLAAELAPKKIRVNGVAPGPIDTPIYGKISPDSALVDSIKSAEVQSTVMKRLGRPEEIADAFLFLASERASYITGIDLRVDSGWADI